MSSGTWRGTVGVVKPTYGSGSFVEFIRLLPEGVGCIPMYAGIKEHSERGFSERWKPTTPKWPSLPKSASI